MQWSFAARLKGRRWLWAILLLAFVLRTYHLSGPPCDYHNWRQSITLMVARDFARHGFDLVHPQVLWIANDRPSDPSYFSGEFSIQSLLAALLYKVVGESDAVARMVTVAFSLLGIYFLYGLVNRGAGPLAASLAAFVYALLPHHLFFGRVFMPDVPALALALGALDALDRWTQDRKWGRLLVAAALAALAVLQKLTVTFLFLPALYLFWVVYGNRLLARIEPYVFAAIAALPSIAWYTHSAAMARESGFAIMQPFRFGGSLGLWLEPSFLKQVLRALTLEAFSPAGLGLAMIGLLWPLRGRTAWALRWWVVGAALMLMLTPEVLPENHYYLCLLLPGGAGAAGLALARLAPGRTAYPLLAVVLLLFTAGAIQSVLPLYLEDRWPWDVGVLLQRLTAPGDLIVTESGGSPNVLYYADRRGWMLNRQYDLARIEQLVRYGANYYADVFPGDVREQREFFQAMDARFERLTPQDGSLPWPIYRLARRLGPPRD